MRVTFSNRVITVALGAVLAAGAPSLLPQVAAASQDRAVQSARGQSPAWRTGAGSAGRGLRWTGGGRPAANVGKIFFTLGRTDYVCSGALVRSRRVDVVLTAAHCVSGGPGQWATNWTFVPGYRDGAEPYGEYSARRFFVSPRWTGPGDRSERYDVAFVQVTPTTRLGRPGVATAPAGLPVRFARRQVGARLGRTYVFGYPALPPFSGQYANYCADGVLVARSGRRAGSAATMCSMTAGDSGGPWLAGFRPHRRTGAIVAVSAYKLSGDKRALYGTVLGRSARTLYRAAARVSHTIPS